MILEKFRFPQKKFKTTGLHDIGQAFIAQWYSSVPSTLQEKYQSQPKFVCKQTFYGLFRTLTEVTQIVPLINLIMGTTKCLNFW